MSVILGARYHLEELVGGGGMGEVWKAHDEVLNRVVAVKIIRPHLADDDSTRARLQVEARLAGSLNHPGIVDVFDYGEDATDGRTVPFLVMPFIDGAPLSTIVHERGSLSVGETMAIVADVADALHAAHAAGIVHRDLKPANILLTSSGRVMLVDFGIARSIDGQSLTQTGALIGTADYLSPEQSAGHAATHLSDLYALGVVAFACLTGTPPFHRDSDIATALAHIQSPIPELPSEVASTEAGTLLNSLLAKEPSARPQSAAGVAFAAREFATTLPDSPISSASVLAASSAITTSGLEATRPGVAPTALGFAAAAPVSAATAAVAVPTATILAQTDFAPPTAVTPVTAAAVNESSVEATAHTDRDRRGPRKVVMLSSVLVLLAVVAAFLFAGGRQVTVPDVRDMTTTQAIARLNADGLKIQTSEVNVADHKAGYVVSQSPSPGDKVDKGSTIKVTVASGRIAIPSKLVGMTYDKAAAQLIKLGLRPARVNTSSPKPVGSVLSVSPKTSARAGDTVTLIVATGPLTTTTTPTAKPKPTNKPKGNDKPTKSDKSATPAPTPAPTATATATPTTPGG